MVRNLIAALNDDLQTLSWMGPQTRAQAAAKLKAFAVKIGYTDKWRDYSALKIERASYLQNTLRGAELISPGVWTRSEARGPHGMGMTPPTVNAYNSSSMNEIVFPRASCSRLLRSQKRTTP